MAMGAAQKNTVNVNIFTPLYVTMLGMEENVKTETVLFSTPLV